MGQAWHGPCVFNFNALIRNLAKTNLIFFGFFSNFFKVMNKKKIPFQNYFWCSLSFLFLVVPGFDALLKVLQNVDCSRRSRSSSQMIASKTSRYTLMRRMRPTFPRMCSTLQHCFVTMSIFTHGMQSLFSTARMLLLFNSAAALESDLKNVHSGRF